MLNQIFLIPDSNHRLFNIHSKRVKSLILQLIAYLQIIPFNKLRPQGCWMVCCISSCISSSLKLTIRYKLTVILGAFTPAANDQGSQIDFKIIRICKVNDIILCGRWRILYTLFSVLNNKLGLSYTSPKVHGQI